jgi:glycosyltransferase involved in cell wall biosynthesis
MIDGFNLALPRGTGVATYGYSLAVAAAEQGWQVDGLYGLRAPFNRRLRDVMFYESLGAGHETSSPIYGSPTWAREMLALVKGRRAREIPIGGRVLSRQFDNRLPAFDRLFTAPDLFDLAGRNFRRTGTFLTIHVPKPPAIMHWTYPFPARVAGARNIYTLHDLVPLKLPYASLDNKRYYYKLMRAVVRKADHLCTVSEASKADIISFFPRAARKITNTYQSVRSIGAPQAESTEELAASLRSIFNLEYKNYFLFYGAVEPKKNVARLIEAYLSLASKTPLVVVGTRAWGSETELRLLQRDEVQPLRATFRNVRRIDYLPRSLLLPLIRGAKAVTFPSLYEGFGLPVLEAMMEGTPVLTGDTSSLPEVAGDAALMVDPYRPRDIAAGLHALDTDPELRARLSAAGLIQAQNFSMTRYRERLSAMYANVLGESRARKEMG